jgi:adenylate kinase family enzyme
VGETATNLEGRTDFTIIFGSAGAGKQTLSKFLRRDPNLVIEENDDEDLVFADNEERIGNIDCDCQM